MLVLYFKLATIKLYLTLSHVNAGLVTHRMRTIEAMTWIPGLSRYKTLKLLAETYFNVSSKQVSADVAPSNIKSRNLFHNVETGLTMLLSSAILFQMLAMNHGRLVVPFSDWLTQRRVTSPSEVVRNFTIISLFHSDCLFMNLKQCLQAINCLVFTAIYNHLKPRLEIYGKSIGVPKGTPQCGDAILGVNMAAGKQWETFGV